MPLQGHMMEADTHSAIWAKRQQCNYPGPTRTQALVRLVLSMPSSIAGHKHDFGYHYSTKIAQNLRQFRHYTNIEYKGPGIFTILDTLLQSR